MRTYCASVGTVRYSSNLRPRSYASVDGDRTSMIRLGFSSVSEVSSRNRRGPQTALTLGYVYNPVSPTFTRMSLLYTRHGRPTKVLPIRHAASTARSECG